MQADLYTAFSLCRAHPTHFSRLDSVTAACQAVLLSPIERSGGSGQMKGLFALGHWACQLPVAAVTNDHKHRGLKQHTLS